MNALIPAQLVAAILRESHVAVCEKQNATHGEAYVSSAFARREITLRDGSRMTVFVATDPCLALGQSTRIFIFKHTRGAYRRVLDDVTLPAFYEVRSDGTVMLPTHETMETMFEAAYVWNGTAYVFSPAHTRIYDIPLGVRRPYQIAINFRRGASAETLSGTVALNFGQDYVFHARAGQTASIELTARRAVPTNSSCSEETSRTKRASRSTRYGSQLHRRRRQVPEVNFGEA